jgi:hypothetical protein
MSAKIHYMGDGDRNQKLYVFHCPGCRYGHNVEVPRWAWNGSFDKPTFSPSLLVNKDDAGSRCHSFVRDGKIQFLQDSHHELRGQTVDLPDWDDS